MEQKQTENIDKNNQQQESSDEEPEMIPIKKASVKSVKNNSKTKETVMIEQPVCKVAHRSQLAIQRCLVCRHLVKSPIPDPKSQEKLEVTYEDYHKLKNEILQMKLQPPQQPIIYENNVQEIQQLQNKIQQLELKVKEKNKKTKKKLSEQFEGQIKGIQDILREKQQQQAPQQLSKQDIEEKIDKKVKKTIQEIFKEKQAQKISQFNPFSSLKHESLQN